MTRYRCIHCTHVYDPHFGDAEGDVPPGTVYEELIDDWHCPDCGGDKNDFEALAEAEMVT